MGQLSVDETMEMEAQADPNNTGSVTFDAFMGVLKNKFAPPFDESQLEKAFDQLRNPENKKLEVAEIVHFLKSYNPSCTQDMLDEFAKKIPTDGKNVDIEGFIKKLTGRSLMAHYCIWNPRNVLFLC